jgi:hypothetical protein
VQKTARPGGIHHETRAHGEALAMAGGFQAHLVIPLARAFHSDFIQIVDTGFLRFAHEKRIDVGAIPMRIADDIPRTGRHQQLVLALRVHGSAAAGLVMIKGEAAFESTGYMRVGLPPRAPFAQRQEVRQMVAGR